MSKWFPVTVGDNRMDAFLDAYEIELRDRLERDPDMRDVELDSETLELHLNLVGTTLRAGTYDVKDSLVRCVIMRLGLPRDHRGLNAWLRQDDPTA